MGIQDEFWSRYFYTWIIGCSFLAALVYIYGSEGRDSVFFYICLGENPTDVTTLPVKKRIFQTTALIINLLLYATLGLRIKLYKQNLERKDNQSERTNSTKQFRKTESLYSYAQNISSIIG